MCFFFYWTRKKGLCADFLVHAAGPENLMIIYFFGLRQKSFRIVMLCYRRRNLQGQKLSKLSIVEETIGDRYPYS